MNHGVGAIRLRWSICQRTEHAGITEGAIEWRAIGVGSRRYRIALIVDGGSYWIRTVGLSDLKQIAIGPAVEIAKHPITRTGSQHLSVHIRPAGRKQSVPQRKEECLVFHNRPTNASRVLVEVCPVSSGGNGLHSIVGPRVRIESAIADVPYRGSVEFVRPGSRLNLDLRVTSADFGIDRSENHADFADQIRVHDRCALNA